MRSLRSSPGRTGLASAQKWPASAQRASGRRLAAPKSPTCCRPFLNGAEPDRARRARPLPERPQWVSARTRGPQHGRRGSAWSNKWRRAKQRLTSRESRSRPPKRTQAQQQLANADPPAPGGGRHGTVRSRRFVPLAGPAQRPAHEPSLFASSEDGRAGLVAAASSKQPAAATTTCVLLASCGPNYVCIVVCLTCCSQARAPVGQSVCRPRPPPPTCRLVAVALLFSVSELAQCRSAGWPAGEP